MEKDLTKTFKQLVSSNRIIFSHDDEYSEFITNVDAVIMCVGTPHLKFKSHFEYLEPLLNKYKDLILNSKILIIRSTVEVGTTSKIKLFFREKFNVELRIAMCPERTLEGDALNELSTLPQIIGSQDSSSFHLAKKVFSLITKNIVRVNTHEGAEFIKLMSNAWRDYSFAFSNLISINAVKWNLNINHLIEAANTDYPRPKIHKPGPVGGPCLTKDPSIFIKSFHFEKSLLSRTRKINRNYVEIMFEKICEEQRINPLDSHKFLLGGKSFKGHPHTSDYRDSPTIDLQKYIEKKTNFTCQIFEPTLGNSKLCSQNGLLIGDLLDQSDFFIIMNNHEFFKSKYFTQLMRIRKYHSKLVWNFADY